MILKDYHIHTSYCDGRNSPEEIVLSAIEKGMTEIGFSGHSYVPFDLDCCMTPEDTEKYVREIRDLKVKYKDSINILCGIEMDYYSEQDPSVFDYCIGSVHYLLVDNKFISVDESPERLIDAINRYFHGDALSLAELYFNTVSDVVSKTNCDIIGHFDLITKFNQNNVIFDTSDERYINSWKNAVDKLVLKNKPFEINTGAISRGYTDFPYPSLDIIEYIISKGGKFVMSSDSHKKETLCFMFEEFYGLAKNNLI